MWASGREDQGWEREGGEKRQALDVWAGLVGRETLSATGPANSLPLLAILSE